MCACVSVALHGLPFVLLCVFAVSLKGATCVQLLFGTSHSILLVDTETNHTTTLPVEGPRTPHSLDVHYFKGYLYYAVHDDLGTRTYIKRRSINFNKEEHTSGELDVNWRTSQFDDWFPPREEPSAAGTSQKTPFNLTERPRNIVSTGVVDELAVDWIQDRIYWLTRKDATVQEADLDGRNSSTVVSRSDVLRVDPSLSSRTELNDLNIDPISRILFVIAHETNTTYTRSILLSLDLNRKELKALHHIQLPPLPKLAVDIQDKRLYIYEPQRKLLTYYNYVQSTLTDPGLPPISKRLSDRFLVSGGTLYWIDPLIGPENIYQLNLTGSISSGNVMNQQLIFAANSSYIHDFKVFGNAMHIKNMEGDSSPDLTLMIGISETTPSTSEKTCTLPNHPNNMYSRFNCPKCQLIAGDTVAHGQLVEVTCDRSHQLVLGLHNHASKSFVVCQNGVWEPTIPRCYKLCPALKSLTLELECWQGPNMVNCLLPMLPNTIVKYRCKPYHEAITTSQPRGFRCGQTGEWTAELPTCTPKCGQSNLNSAEIQPTIVGGRASAGGNFPWHAGIYTSKAGKWGVVCGGTLISTRVVLTAAHCVTVSCLTCKAPDTAGNIMVALGKNFHDWYNLEESEIKRTVTEVTIHPNYIGSSLNYGQDIAVLFLESEVEVSRFVLPACIDYERKYIDQLTTGIKGYIAGWGNTKECSFLDSTCSGRSDQLMFSRAAVIDFNSCYLVTQTIKRFPISRLSHDKLCTTNASETVVQRGDSGGGLTFVFDGLHYVYGIVSVKLKLEQENQLFYNFGAFTNVPLYIDWITSQLIKE